MLSFRRVCFLDFLFPFSFATKQPTTITKIWQVFFYFLFSLLLLSRFSVRFNDSFVCLLYKTFKFYNVKLQGFFVRLLGKMVDIYTIRK